MAVVTVADAKNIKPFSGSPEWIEATYDFAVEGGASANTFVFFTAKVPVIVLGGYIQTLTGVTSGGSATVEVGISGSTASIIAQSAKTAVDVANETIAVTVGKYVPADGTIYMTVGTADLTAGKLKLGLLVMKTIAGA